MDLHAARHGLRLLTRMVSCTSRRSLRRPLFVVVSFCIFGFLLRAIGQQLGDASRMHHVHRISKKIHLEFGNASPGKLSLLPDHLYRADGLLEVNPEGAHPIFELLRHAEEEWNAKLSRASTTLHDAVAEYQRRYDRLPPVGFDAWWKYVQDHNVQLPDEYDQIHRDMEPFWGMDPHDLQRIQRDWEAHEDSYTIGKESQTSPIRVLNYTLPDDEQTRDNLLFGAFQNMDILEQVWDYIPPFRAIFTPHDNPNLATDYELLQSARQAAREGTTIDINDPPEVKLHGWISACDPFSAAWKDPIEWETPLKPHNKTFIYNHRASMDPCLHPSLLLSHGQYLSNRGGPVPHRTIIPQFAYCTTPIHHDMMTALPINWMNDLSPQDNPPWHDRTDERLLWRGRNTGIWHSPETRWADAHRARLVRWAEHNLREDVVVLSSPTNEHIPVGLGRNISRGKLAPALLDIHFAGEPINCPPEFCEELAQLFEYRRPQSFKAAGNYKYVLDVDGNGWSSRFQRLMTTNSLIFKSTIYPEWFTDRVAPWVHFIPVQVDFSDLYDSLLFFRGDSTGANGHDDIARRIASSGRDWSRRFWRREDMTAYMFRLFLEYARVMSTDRLTMDYGSRVGSILEGPDDSRRMDSEAEMLFH